MSARARAFALSIAAAGLIGGCQEPEGYRLRWSVRSFADATAQRPPALLTTATQCSGLGIDGVEVTVFDELTGALLDRRSFPCFFPGLEDPERRARGPNLGSGQACVLVRGLRRDGTAWAQPPTEELCDDADPPSCTAEPLPLVDLCRGDAVPSPAWAFATQRDVALRDDGAVTLDDVALDAAPECFDGVDNDRDGLVDGRDVACRGDALDTVRELDDRGIVQFVIDVSLLDDNPSVRCDALGIAGFAVAVGGDATLVPTTACASGRPPQLRFALPLQPGASSLAVTAVDAAGVALTRAETVDFTVPEGVGGLVQGAVDFPGDAFLSPIVADIQFVLNLRTADAAREDRLCGEQVGTLAVDRARLQIVDGTGAPVSVATVQGPALDGSEVACSGNVVITAPLTWGSYAVAADVLADTGEVCFTTAPTPVSAAPGNAVVVDVARVLPPPASCRECSGDGDCPADAVCDADGICRPA
jgi:hypothetical protein